MGRHLGRGRRRAFALVSGVAMLAVAVPLGMFGAGADVGPVGPVTLTITAGELTTSAGTFGPLTGTFVGTVAADGGLAFPASGIVFEPFDVTTSTNLMVHIVPVAGDFSGLINPATGAVTLSGAFTTILGLPQLGDPPVTDCPLGPIALNLSTAAGTAYNPTTGAVGLVDNTFVIQAIAAGQQGCNGLEGAINFALMLPNAAGDLTLSLTGAFSPLIDVVTTTSEPPTTTTPPTTEPPTTTTPTTTTPPPTTAPPTTTPPTTSAPTTTPPTTATTASTTSPTTVAGQAVVTTTTKAATTATSPTTVQAAAVTDTLPRTGSSTLPAAVLGLGLLGAGLALATRRRLASR